MYVICVLINCCNCTTSQQFFRNARASTVCKMCMRICLSVTMIHLAYAAAMTNRLLWPQAGVTLTERFISSGKMLFVIRSTI